MGILIDLNYNSVVNFVMSKTVNQIKECVNQNKKKYFKKILLLLKNGV